MFELKALTPGAVPAALEKAVRYRLLNEPEQAESICHDVLRVEPDNQNALTTLILALTDRLSGPRPVLPQLARDLLPRLHGEYDCGSDKVGIAKARPQVFALHVDRRGGFIRADRLLGGRRGAMC